MEFRRPISLLLAASFMIGCSDSSGPSTPINSTASVKGKVIDGYVSGATIFLDINNNGLLDKGEPNTLSTSAGEYNLELNASDQLCLDYVPIIVDVPVGAIDEDLGPVNAAYQLVLPASKADLHESNHITPLTTLAWDAMSIELSKDYFEVGCEGIKNNTELHKRLLTTLDQSTVDLGGIYNLTPEQIYGDFIANGDTAAHELAMNIVVGYQKSFAERADLIASGANVWSYAYTFLEATERYADEKQRGYKWLLDYAYSRPTSALRHEQLEGSVFFKNDFADKIDTSYRHLDNTNAELDDHGAIRKYGVSAYLNDFDNPSYQCTTQVLIENVYTDINTDFTSYQRSSAPFNVANVALCVYQALLPEAIETEEIRRDLWNQKFAAYFQSSLSPLADLDLDDFSHISAEIDSWPVAWDESFNFDNEPHSWYKQITESISGAYVTTARNQDGYIHKTTTNSDGTYVRECPEDPDVMYPEVPSFSPNACQ